MAAYEDEFRRMILRGVNRALLQLQESTDAQIPDKLRRRAWMALDYALDLPEAWPITFPLLLLLAQKLEQTGYRYDWLPFLQRGLAYSQASAARAAEGALRTEIGWVQQRLGNLEEARCQLTAACAWLRLYGTGVAAATALGRLAEIARLQRQYVECHKLIDELLSQVAADSNNAAFGYFVLGKAAFDQAQLEQAEGHFQRALAIWRPHDQRRMALCIQNLARIAWRHQQHSDDIRNFEEALAIFKAQGDQPNHALVKMNLGVVYWEIGQVAEALDYYNQAITVFREVGYTLYLAMAYNNCGLAHSTLAQWTAAADYYRLSIELWSKLGDIKSRVEPQIGLAVVYTRQQRLTEALALFATSAQQLQQVDPDHAEEAIWQELQDSWAAAKAGAGDQAAVN